MNPPFLTQPLADALCTVILTGFIKQVANANFQFENTDQADYATVQQLLKSKLGIDFKFSQSIAQSDLALIGAGVKALDMASFKQSGDEYSRVNQLMQAVANNLPDSPKGAYIGGLSSISSLSLVGPSQLSQYAPVYRQPETAPTVRKVATSPEPALSQQYSQGITDINNAINATKTALNKPSLVTNKPTYSIVKNSLDGPQTVDQLQPKNVFKSVHGMIRAMVNYQTNSDKNAYVFEIALGKNTSKVSSCFPCSMYMLAGGKPATSIHLGRGDCWNLPATSSNAENQWRTNINSYYAAGKTAFQGAKLHPELFTALKSFEGTNIPDIFLEALTFTGKFTDKVKETLQ